MADSVLPGAFRRNVKWQFAGSVSQLLLSGLVLLVTGRELGTDGFGVFSIVMGFVYVANLLFEPRMQDVAARQFWDFTRGGADRPGHAPYFVDLLAVEVLGKLLPCIGLVVLAPWLANHANLAPEAAGLIRIAAVGTYLSRLGYGLSLGLLRVLGRTDVFAYCATGELALRLVLTLALVGLSRFTVAGCIVIVALSGTVSNLVQAAIAARRLDGLGRAVREWKLADSLNRLRENRRLLLSNLGLSVSDLMNKDLDVTLIAPMMPADQVGIYKMAKNITLLTWRAIDPFYLALMPEMSRLVSLGDHAAVRRLVSRSSLGLFALAIGLSLASYLLLLLFGGQVLGASFTAVPGLMPWMLVGIVVSAPLVWGHPLAVALDRADVAFTGSLVGSAVGLAAFLILTPAHGLRGAGAAWTLTFLLTFTFTAGVSQSLFRNRMAATR